MGGEEPVTRRDLILSARVEATRPLRARLHRHRRGQQAGGGGDAPKARGAHAAGGDQGVPRAAGTRSRLLGNQERSGFKARVRTARMLRGSPTALDSTFSPRFPALHLISIHARLGRLKFGSKWCCQIYILAPRASMRGGRMKLRRCTAPAGLVSLRAHAVAVIVIARWMRLPPGSASARRVRHRGAGGLAAGSKRRVSVGVVNAMLALATVLAAACGSNSGGGGGGALPTLSYAGATGMVDDVGTAMRVSPTTLASNGAALTACGVKPGSANASAFPGTLSVDASTCVISGTPTAPLPATQFTLVATNSAGTSADATVTLTIHAGWLKQMGVAFQYSLATGVAVDASGNSYVAGSTNGGQDGYTHTAIDDYFIANYNSSGDR